MNYIALVGNIPDAAVKKLSDFVNIEKVYRLPPDTLIDSPISNHPDTIMCIHGGKLYCHELYAEKNESLLSEICRRGKLTLCPQSGERSGVYPFDCTFNALCVNGRGIGRKKSLCPPLSEICINTNQGYAACCGLDAGGTVITADPSIKKSCEKHGIPVFTIDGVDILLPGYENGFIGGACGFCEGRLFTFGDAGAALIDFCRARGFELISLRDGPLTDYGGIKFIPTA